MSEKRLTIRPARPADAGLIRDLIHELASYEKQPEECYATSGDVRRELFGRTPAAEVIIALADAEPAGFALFFHSFSTWECARGLYLEDLFVRPSFRRHGVGRALMEALARLAVDRGCKRFEFNVLDWNQLGIDFYAGLGAEAIPGWTIHRISGSALIDLAGQASDPQPLPEDGPVVIHTDGGAQPNPGVGGWAAVIRQGETCRELSGGEDHTTNNRMELTAAIEALSCLSPPARVTLHTDSQYVKNGITKWLAGWKRKGWRTTSGKVKNRDLWERLDALCAQHEISWHWVRGHAGDPDNERCDELCNLEIAKRA